MPIPLIVWGIAAAGAAALAWKNKDKIKEFAESESGKKLGRSLKEGFETVVTAQYDPEVRDRLHKHMMALLDMYKISDSGRILDIVATSAIQATYLNRLPRKDVQMLSMYVSQMRNRAEAASAADRDDDASAQLAAKLQSLSRDLAAHLQNRPNEAS